MLHNKDLFTSLENSNLFIDTNVLIGSLYLKEILDFIYELKIHKCEILSIPAVAIEFFRGNQKASDQIEVKDTTAAGFNKRVEFYKSVVRNTYQIEKHLDNIEEFIVVLNKTNRAMEFPDFSLAACLYHFKKSKTFLMTSNTHHFESPIFNRDYIITPETGKKITNYCIYSFSDKNFMKAAENILEKENMDKLILDKSKHDPDFIPF